jgi:hypothetical protein
VATRSPGTKFAIDFDLGGLEKCFWHTAEYQVDDGRAADLVFVVQHVGILDCYEAQFELKTSEQQAQQTHHGKPSKIYVVQDAGSVGIIAGLRGTHLSLSLRGWRFA